MIFAILSSQDKKMDFFFFTFWLRRFGRSAQFSAAAADESFTAFTAACCPPSSWSSAAASPRSVQTARSQTSRRRTARSLPWSPVCSIASQCDRCFRSAWNRSATGLWPCYRLQGRGGGKQTMWPVTGDTHNTAKPREAIFMPLWSTSKRKDAAGSQQGEQVRPRAPYLTGWCRWASLWWWFLQRSGCWRTGRWRGCSSWGPAWTRRACSGWWGAEWRRWCPGRPDAAPPRYEAYFCCPADLGKAGTPSEETKPRLRAQGDVLALLRIRGVWWGRYLACCR